VQVTDYANGTAPRSELIRFEGMWVSPDLYRRLNYVFQYIRNRGGKISGTEGYRWKGVPNDANIRDASKTSDGTSNQWYQKGRQRRGETPAAATPGYSQHGYGKSADTNTDSPKWRDEAMRHVGMERTVKSETWHADIVRAPLIDLTAFEYKKPSSGGSTPPPPPPPPPVTEETPMYLSRRPAKDGGTIGLFGIPGRGWMPFLHKDHYEMWRVILIDSGVKLAGGVDMPDWAHVTDIREYGTVAWDNQVIAHTVPTQATPDNVDEAAIAAFIVQTLKTQLVFKADVDEKAIAEQLSPLIAKSVLDGMAGRLKS